MLKFLPILLIFLFLLTGCNNSDPTNNTEASRLSAQENTKVEGSPPPTSTPTPTPTPFVPIQLGTFTTTIYTKTPERQNNVKIACQELNGTIVNVRRNFFFHRNIGAC